ncbi:hypothetical protein AJ79_04894 [Helicocarpus griseus UAMH5409]|uniref:LIM zinc-binding domain-containing protein n=1 Tax=Helicocarpus griseus UAMH5409 TaxID=1447875 RepID=A0A2B7XRK9_9EURO|nr:hypothetical protein AJ79_04894 [Helicocarpus griseus UAMH5409]
MEVSMCTTQQWPLAQSSIGARDSLILESHPSRRPGSRRGARSNTANTLEGDIGVATSDSTCVTAQGGDNRGVRPKRGAHYRTDSHSSVYTSRTKAANHDDDDICVKCGMTIVNEFVSALGGVYHPHCFTCHDCRTPLHAEFFPQPSPAGPIALCETDLFRRLDMLCSECGGALRDLYISALGRKYHMNHFTCHACKQVIGPGDNYYIHGGKAYCRDDYSAKYADRCYGCGMSIMDQYIKVYSPTTRVWHGRCYKVHKRHNPESPLAEVEIPDEGEEGQNEEGVEGVLGRFEAMVAGYVGDGLGYFEEGCMEKIAEGISTLINAVGVLFRSIDGVDDARREAGKDALSDSPEIDLLRAKLTDFMTVSLSKSSQRTRTTSSHLKEMYAASSGLIYFMKKVIKTLGEGTPDTANSLPPETYLTPLSEFSSDLPPAATTCFTATELARGDAELCQVCSNPIASACISWHGYLRRQHLGCKSPCARCDVSDDPTNMKLVLISPPGDSYALCCCACREAEGSNSDAAPPPVSCKPVTKLQQYLFLLRVQFERLRNPAGLHTIDIQPHVRRYLHSSHQRSSSTASLPALTEKASHRSLVGDKGRAGDRERDRDRDSNRDRERGIFGRFVTGHHRIFVAEDLFGRATAEKVAFGARIGSSYQGFKRGLGFGRGRERGMGRGREGKGVTV